MFVYLGLGTNQGDRNANLQQALARLATIIVIQRESNVYESAPMYVTNQPYFFNMAIMGETPLPPHELLKALKTIEADMGRDLGRNAQRYGPRPIDIDILLVTKVLHPHDASDYIVMNEPNLNIPHLRLAERAFVLTPLLDITADNNIIHPTLRKTLYDLREQVKEQNIRDVGLLVRATITASKDIESS